MTHNLTHTGKCAERFKEHRAGSLAFLPGVLVKFRSGLQHLVHKISHGFRRLVLHLPGGAGVGAQGEPRIVVAQHTPGSAVSPLPVLTGHCPGYASDNAPN